MRTYKLPGYLLKAGFTCGQYGGCRIERHRKLRTPTASTTVMLRDPRSGFSGVNGNFVSAS